MTNKDMHCLHSNASNVAFLQRTRVEPNVRLRRRQPIVIIPKPIATNIGVYYCCSLKNILLPKLGVLSRITVYLLTRLQLWIK